jgi:hypothetical protein
MFSSFPQKLGLQPGNLRAQARNLGLLLRHRRLVIL